MYNHFFLGVLDKKQEEYLKWIRSLPLCQANWNLEEFKKFLNRLKVNPTMEASEGKLPWFLSLLNEPFVCEAIETSYQIKTEEEYNIIYEEAVTFYEKLQAIVFHSAQEEFHYLGISELEEHCTESLKNSIQSLTTLRIMLEKVLLQWFEELDIYNQCHILLVMVFYIREIETENVQNNQVYYIYKQVFLKFKEHLAPEIEINSSYDNLIEWLFITYPTAEYSLYEEKAANRKSGNFDGLKASLCEDTKISIRKLLYHFFSEYEKDPSHSKSIVGQIRSLAVNIL